MALDPRTPVIVGVAQLTRRPQRPEEMTSPVEMMAEVVEQAAADAGVTSLARHAQSIYAVDVITWRHENLAQMLAEAIGAEPVDRVTSSVGGNTPQLFVNDASRRIQAGELDLVILAGAEVGLSRRMAREQGVSLPWARRATVESAPDRLLGTTDSPSHEAELERGLIAPIQLYPVFENALRHAEGRHPNAHLGVLGTLWSRFSRVAARNPYAWQPTALSAQEIVTAREDNRMVAYPYTKLLCANLNVDQAAALILCSVEAAEIAGVSRDRWVFPLAGADAHDRWFVSERADLHASPAIRACGRTVFDLAGVAPADLEHVDLYSCFPSAVEVAAKELGLGLFERDLTVTGGLTFAGGPGNNYVTHSIAATVERLRADGGQTHALVTGNGWYLTKHSLGIYSNSPAEHGFRWESPQTEVDALPGREVARDHDGDVTVESFTVMHERDGSPGTAFVACLLDDGRRAWGTTSDPDEMKALEESDLVGTQALLSGGTVVLG